MSDFSGTFLNDIASGALVRKETDDALQQDDTAAYFRGIQEQRRQAGMATVEVGLRGGDPLHETAPIGQFVSPQVEMERRFIELAKKTRALDTTLETGGFGDIQEFLRGVADRYREHNQTESIKKPANEQEWLAQVQQMRPVTVDPNEVANIRQIAVKLDQQMKALDPTWSFWTHPKTRAAGAWLNREAGGGQVGYFTSGEQKLNLGVTGTAAMMGVEAIEGASDFGLNLVHGGWDLADQAVRALGGDGLGPMTPTNYIEGPNGELIPNGGKVPGFLDSMNMLWAAAAGRNVEQAAAEMNRTREMELASRNGFQTIALGGSRIFGMGFGFGLPAGAAMNVGAKSFGALGTRGMQWLGTLGMKGAQSERALKITRLMSAGLGAGIANGMAEGVAYGRAEGYGKAFLHGMAMAPVLLTLGALGKRAEWFAENRLKMPKRVAEQVGAALEGVGFGAMEAGTLPFMPAAWDFIRNPHESTWETYLKNVAGFMLFKGMTRGRSVNPATATMDMAATQVRRATGRVQFAEKVARGEATPEEIARAEQETGTEAAALRALGEASMRAREARTPQEREQALQERRRIEEELDRGEFGLEPPAEAEARALEPEGTGQPDLMERAEARRRRTQAEIEGMGPEELLEWGKRNFREGMAARERGELSPEDAQKARERAEKERTQAADPLEDPRFGTLPKDVQEAIIAAPDIQARRDIMLREAPERRKSQIGLPEGVTGERRVRPPESRTTADVPRETLEQRALEGRGRPAEPRTTLEQRPQEQRGERMGPQSLQVPPTRQLAGEPGVEPVRAADIYLEMSGRPGRRGFRIPFTAKRIGGTPGDVVRVPIAGGRIGRRGVLGVFKLFENLMRTAEGRDLVVASHEWSHAMHRHTLGRAGKELVKLSKQQAADAIQSDPRIKAEMAEMLKDYPGAEPGQMPLWQRWMETWAEWHARNLLGEVGLDQKFPALGRFMRSWLAKPEQAALREQYGRIQTMLDRYNRQGSYQRERQSMFLATDKPSESQKAQEPGWVEKRLEEVNVALFDDMARLKSSQRKWLELTGRKPEDVDIMDDPARVFDALRMTAGKTAEFYVRKGMKGPDGQDIRGLGPIMKDLKGLEEPFAVYLSAVRNAQLWKRGKKPTLPIADHLENIRNLQRAHPEFRTLARELKQWTDGLVDYVARSGNLDPEVAQRIKDSYVLYVPFFRAIEGPRAHPQARGVAEGGTGLKRIEGSSYEIRDPLVALQDVAQRMIAKAHQNIVMNSLYKLAAGYEAGGIATVVPTKNVPKEHPVWQVLNALERQVELPGDKQHVFESILDALKSEDALTAQTITLFTQKVIPTGERNIIAFTPRLTEAEINRLAMDSAHKAHLMEQQGKLQWLEINDPRIYEALMGIDQMPQVPPALQPFMRILKGPRDLVRFFATGVAPGFVAANMLRDALSYPIFTRDGDFRPFGGIVKLVQGAIEYHRNGEMRQLYEELGVKTSSFFTEGEKQKVVGQRGERGMVRESIATVQHWAQRAQDFFAHPENYLRMAEFKRTYEQAKKEGASEEKARMLALEAGREITVNFARAGILGRVLNQSIPYFNAGFQGKRKLWGQLLWGGDVQGDAAKARVQRAAILNGIANITMPSIALWLMNREEDWYQDLPEWRKSGYWNMKFGDTIASIPKPFEAGALFGAIPEALLERAFDENGNPISMRRAALDTLGAYTEGIGALLPAALKPMVEVGFNWNSFAGRPLTPEWVQRSTTPSEQATFYTTETAKIVSRAINGVLTPIEIEQLLGGYTAGGALAAFKAFEDVTGIKDHPVAVNPIGRFFRQAPHGQSRYVDQLYDLSVELDQLEGSGKLSTEDQRLRRQVETAKRQISELRAAYREGRIPRGESEERAYQIARPLVEEWNR